MKTRVYIHDELLARAKRRARETGHPLRAPAEDGPRKVLDEPASHRKYRLPDMSVGDTSGTVGILRKFNVMRTFPVCASVRTKLHFFRDLLRTKGMMFKRYIGIDYSGARRPDDRLTGLQVYEASSDGVHKVVAPANGAMDWTRPEVAEFCARSIDGDGPVIIGIDHAFSFPISYMDRYGIETWDQFLDDFAEHWPTTDPDKTVHSLRNNSARTGDSSEFRLSERWTSGAKSVFQFGVPGEVATSTHAGLTWLRWLRNNENIRSSVHFWPFDGFEVPRHKSVIAEVYPSLFRRRYCKADRTGDQQDAYATARWLAEMDSSGNLKRYFDPLLSKNECRLARREGWILGVC